VRLFRGLAAILLVLLGCWCLMWLVILVALGFAAKHHPLTDYLILAAWVPTAFGAAYLIQPWLAHPWRRADES